MSVPDFRDKGLEFRGRNKDDIAYNNKKKKAVNDISWHNKDVYPNYLEQQASLQKDLRDMDNPINQGLLDEAKIQEYLRQHPHREEDCLKNAQDCVTGAWRWAFPTKSNNTIQYDSKKKNNGGKKSRKSHNSKKYKKSKKSHTTYKKSKRSRR